MSSSARCSSAVSTWMPACRDSTRVRRSWTLAGLAWACMCGRYTLTSNDRQRLGERFGAIMPDAGLERYNVAPTEAIAAVVVGKSGEREGHALRWGLVPGYAKSLKGGPPMFNARSETVAEKRPFKDLLAKPRGRCLILAD